MYCDTWNLTVNISKTKVVVFSRGKIRKKPVFYFGDKLIEVAEGYSYLGVQFNFNNKFNKSKALQVNQAQRALYSLLTKSRNLQLPIDLQLQLFDQLVLPVLLYGWEIWGFEDLKIMESFQLKFFKNILRVNKYTPNCMVYGELGRHKLNNTVDVRMVSFWGRLVNGSAHKLSCMMYRLLRTLHDKKIYSSPWILKVHSVFNNTGLSYIWGTSIMNHPSFYSRSTLFPVSYIKSVMTQRVGDIYKQEWLSEVNTNSQCSIYRIFKKKLELEKYLKILNMR